MAVHRREKAELATDSPVVLTVTTGGGGAGCWNNRTYVCGYHRWHKSCMTIDNKGGLEVDIRVGASSYSCIEFIL